MAKREHVAQLRKGALSWNAWRKENPDIRPDLSKADLREEDFSGADLSGASLSRARLAKANLSKANLREANLSRATLQQANLRGADLSKATLTAAILNGTNLSGANLSGAFLWGAPLFRADLSGANLRGADLRLTTLVDTNLADADLSGCRIYGVSAWGLELRGAKQLDLIITLTVDEPEITVDNIEVAQFIYLMLNNQKIRDVINTITSKAVLILGRFTDERKRVLDALREELRKRDYLPILFDFDVPERRNVTETQLLATLADVIAPAEGKAEALEKRRREAELQ
jgi:Pentapeptide repeats (8 copies)